MQKTLTIGRDSRGFLVSLEMQIKHETRDARTTALEPLHEYDVLTISGSYHNGGGQCQDTIRQELDSYRELFIPKASVVRILDIWDVYHLNDMHAGTSRQEEAIQKARTAPKAEEVIRSEGHYTWASGVLRCVSAAPYKVEFEYTGTDENDPNRGIYLGVGTDCQHLTREAADARAQRFTEETGRKTQVVAIGNLYNDMETKPGEAYKYGSAWLVGALPEEIKTEILSLFDVSTPEPKTPFEEIAEREGITLTCEKITTRPDLNTKDWGEGSRHFKCRIERGTGPRKRGFTLYYSQGSAHTENPTIGDVLESLSLDASSYENARGFEDWASELGYCSDSRKAEKVYKSIKRQAEQLKRVLGADVYKQLLEVGQ